MKTIPTTPIHHTGVPSLGYLMAHRDDEPLSPARDDLKVVIVSRTLTPQQYKYQLSLLTAGGFHPTLIEDSDGLNNFLNSSYQLQSTGAVLVDQELGWDETMTGAEVIRLLYQLDYRGLVAAAPASLQKVQTIDVCHQQDALLRAGARCIARWTENSLVPTLRSLLGVQQILFPCAQAA